MEHEPNVLCTRISNEASCVSRENKNLVIKKPNSKTWTLHNGKVWGIEHKDGRHRSNIAKMCPFWTGILPSLEEDLCSPRLSLTLADWCMRNTQLWFCSEPAVMRMTFERLESQSKPTLWRRVGGVEGVPMKGWVCVLSSMAPLKCYRQVLKKPVYSF